MSVAADTAFEARMLRAALPISVLTPGYKRGGGHERALSLISARQALDCSSSTSLFLRRLGVWGLGDWALVSGAFDGWGAPGPGRLLTVYFNDEHVFVQARRWRLDTSPHGGPEGRGPKVRRGARMHTHFQARHVPGR